jgi:hypothetical protein
MLTERQKRFADEYVVSLNGTQAAIRAGYSEAGARQEGSRQLANVNVRALIDQRRQEKAADLDIQFSDVLRGLVTAFEDAKAQGQTMAMVAACRELGKLLGYYDKQFNGKGQSGGTRRYEEMSDAELLALAQGEDW